MRRKDLEHVIRAAGAVAEVRELIIIGSQSILGRYPDAPDELLASLEVDTYPSEEPDKSELIDGSIGELSPFHKQFGYYAHGVGPETAQLPRDWRQRVVVVSNENTGGITGLCLAPADLAVSKLLAGRDKDLEFVRALCGHGLVDQSEISALSAELPPGLAGRLTLALERCLADR